MHDYLIIPPTGTPHPNTVSDVWLSNTKNWDTKDNTIIWFTCLSQIVQVPVTLTNEPDRLSWTPAPSGVCTSKYAFRVLATAAQQPPPSQGSRSFTQDTLNILKVVWKDKLLQPRTKTFAWRLLRNALPTGARAHRFSQHIEESCSRCSVSEHDHHLFFACSFLRAVWFSSPPLRADTLPVDGHGT
jgi:hypothetical protein